MDDTVRILCVDDEKNVLRALERLFIDDGYEILTALSEDEGLEILRKVQPVQIVISDYRMPGTNGVDFLKKVCRHWPDTVRIVLSGYADTAAVVSAVNEGQIYKFIPKPWNDDELKMTISNALERYYLNKRNIQLTEELKEKNAELQKMNDHLERLVNERTEKLLFQNKVLRRAQNILDSLPVAVLGLEINGMIVQCNRKGMALLGRERGVVGMERRDLLPEEMNGFIDRVMEGTDLAGSLMIGDAEVNAKGSLMKYPDGQEGVVLVFDVEAPLVDEEVVDE